MCRWCAAFAATTARAHTMEVRFMPADAITEIAGLEPTYSAREAAALLGRSYSWLDQRLRQGEFVRPDGTVVQLRTTKSVAHSLPSQFTSFVGRGPQLAEVRELLAHNRLVTLTGAGGVGKTRLAVEVANELAADYAEGVWYVDLAPITDPGLVPGAVARALGLPDQPGRSTMETVLRFVHDRQMLVVLDNCEHLLDACAELVVVLLVAGGLTLLATSREPIGVP